MTLDTLTLSVSTEPGVTNRYKSLNMRLEVLAAAVRNPANWGPDKMSCRSVVACHLEDNSRAKGKGARPTNVFALDCDGLDMTVNELTDRLAPWGYVLWHTASSGVKDDSHDGRERVRVLLPLSRKVDSKEYKRVGAGIMQRLGLTDTVLPVKQFMFLPTVRSAAMGILHAAGEAVDVDTIVPGDAGEADAAKEMPEALAGNAVEVAEALAAIPVSELDGTGLWLELAMAVKAGLGEDGYELFDAWCSQGPNYSEEGNRARWDSIRESVEGGISLDTLFFHAEQHGYSRFHAAEDGDFLAFEQAQAQGKAEQLAAEWVELDREQIRMRVSEAMLAEPSAVVRGQLAKLAAPRLGCRASDIEADRKAALRKRRIKEATYPDVSDDGMVLASARNARHFVVTVLGDSLSFDTFGRVLLMDGRPVARDEGRDRAGLRVMAEDTGLRGVSDVVLWDAVEEEAQAHSFDSLQAEWEMLPAWDGIDRLDTLLTTYFGVDQSDYVSAVGRYMMTALAGRAMAPGCQADMAVILAGEQGYLKSSIVRALSGNRPERYGELVKKHIQSADELARFVKRKVVVEYAEMKGMRTADQDDIKSLMTRQYDEERPMRKDNTVQHPRRGIFIGTYNPDALKGGVLTDGTGNRRWLPVDVVRMCDPMGLLAVYDQVRAEALAAWRAHGIEWQRAEALAGAAHESHMARSAWADAVTDILAERDDAGFILLNTLADALNLKSNAVGMRDVIREVERQGWPKVRDMRRGPWRGRVMFCRGGELPNPDKFDDF